MSAFIADSFFIKVYHFLYILITDFPPSSPPTPCLPPSTPSSAFRKGQASQVWQQSMAHLDGRKPNFSHESRLVKASSQKPVQVPGTGPNPIAGNFTGRPSHTHAEDLGHFHADSHQLREADSVGSPIMALTLCLLPLFSRTPGAQLSTWVWISASTG